MCSWNERHGRQGKASLLGGKARPARWALPTRIWAGRPRKVGARPTGLKWTRLCGNLRDGPKQTRICQIWAISPRDSNKHDCVEMYVMGRRKLELFVKFGPSAHVCCCAKKKCDNGKTKTQIRAFISTTAGGAFYFSIIVVKYIVTYIYIYISFENFQNRGNKRVWKGLPPTCAQNAKLAQSLISTIVKAFIAKLTSIQRYRSTRNHLNSKRWSESCSRSELGLLVIALCGFGVLFVCLPPVIHSTFQ
jgi:hypothetical protein